MLAAVDPTIAIMPAIIAAMGGILKLVLNALREQREAFEKFLGNHMSNNTKALDKIADNVSANTQATKDMTREVAYLRRDQERRNGQ